MLKNGKTYKLILSYFRIKNTLFLKRVNNRLKYSNKWRFFIIFILSLALFLNLLPIWNFKDLLNAFGGATENINIYTTQCTTDANPTFSNGWWNVEKAQGEQNLPVDATIQSFNDGNSAFYNGGNSSLVCGRFSINAVNNEETENYNEAIASSTNEAVPIPDNSQLDNDSSKDIPEEMDVQEELENILNKSGEETKNEEPTISNTQQSEVDTIPENTETEIEINEIPEQESNIEVISPEFPASEPEVIIETDLIPESVPESSSEPVTSKIINKFISLFTKIAQAQENAIKAKDLKELGNFVNARIKISYAHANVNVNQNGINEEDTVNEIPDEKAGDDIRFWYTTETSAEPLWQELGWIKKEDISNALNGGYLEFEAPLLDSWEKINDLKIKVDGSGSDNALIIYIDSIWVEASYEGEKTETKDKRLSSALEFISGNQVFEKGGENEMKFKYHKKEDNLFSTLSGLIGLSEDNENFWNRISVQAKVVNAFDNEIDLPLSIIFGDDGTFAITLPNDRDLRPGEYKLKIIIEDDTSNDLELLEFSQNFSWGVLAINTNKGVYLNGETAYVQMAVLDEYGHTICDAGLDLIVTSPDGSISELSTANGKIIRNPECGPDNVINTPDYYAYYPINSTGEHDLRLVASTSNGIKEITEKINVSSDVPFSIERIGPTRINPMANYDMTFMIKANQDFTGPITEYVPLDFEITKQNIQIKTADYDNFEDYFSNASTSERYQFIINQEDQIKKLSWENINIVSGDILKIVYTFDAPNISPELFTLGPAEIGEYRDVRNWQIASDDVASYNFNNGSGATWTYPTRAWDSTDDSYAYRTIPRRSVDDSANYLEANANTGVPSSIDDITKVEIGVEGYVANTAVTTYLIPRFGGSTAGSAYTITGTTMGTTDNDTTKYVDITSDANAPSTWSWSDIENLDIRLYGLNTSNASNYALYIDQFRVRVTYTPNTAPTGSFVSAVERQDGSGIADISVEVDDGEDDNVRAKLEYVVGSDCNFASPLDPEIDTTDGNTTADYGDPKVDNASEYQVGSSTGWIITSSGSNTVNFDWTTLKDISSGDGTYCLRLTTNDVYLTQTSPATTTLTVDNVAPTAPGALTKNRATKNTIDLAFGSQTTESNFLEYKIFWKEYDGTPPTEANNVISSTTDINLAVKDFNSKATTTISGLLEDHQYSFNIWAYDKYNHKSSSSVVNITTNKAPTSKFNSAVERSNGSGIVDISIDVADYNYDNCQAEIEYVAGAGCNFSTSLDPILDETQGNISSTYGVVKIENDNSYQIGNSSGWIPTTGTNTVQFDWTSLSNVSDTEDTYCLRLTANDQYDNQDSSPTYTFMLDNKNPTTPGSLSSGGVASSSVILNFGTASSDLNFQRYRIFYKKGTSGVTTSDSQYSNTDLLSANYGGTSNTAVTGLDPNSDYVFNIWAYDSFGHSVSATEITLKTNATLLNNSLTFTNPYTANYAIADGSTNWNFRAIVSEDNGWENIDQIVLRLADNNDNTSPYNDLEFQWTQSSNTFSEIGTDTNNAVTLSPSSSSLCTGILCTIDFKLVINGSFETTSQNYNAQLYSANDSAVFDLDNYTNVYQVKVIKLKQIHYRWRNDNGGE